MANYAPNEGISEITASWKKDLLNRVEKAPNRISTAVRSNTRPAKVHSALTNEPWVTIGQEDLDNVYEDTKSGRQALHNRCIAQLSQLK